MLPFIVGVLCMLAVIFIRDESSTPYKLYRPDPWVILALEEMDEGD